MRQRPSLDDLLERQLASQRGVYGTDPGDIADREQACNYFRTNMLAVFVELGELAQEVGWKPWREGYGEIDNVRRFDDELADAFRHLLNICLVTNTSGDDIVDALERSWKKSVERDGGRAA
jgi:NTP pyrophosphatase (non-canonical NTP hydrolase)